MLWAWSSHGLRRMDRWRCNHCFFLCVALPKPLYSRISTKPCRIGCYYYPSLIRRSQLWSLWNSIDLRNQVLYSKLVKQIPRTRWSNCLVLQTLLAKRSCFKLFPQRLPLESYEPHPPFSPKSTLPPSRANSDPLASVMSPKRLYRKYLQIGLNKCYRNWSPQYKLCLSPAELFRTTLS